jgi:hypothetical protein
MTQLAYHFVADTLRNGEPIPPDNEWLKVDADSLIMCEYGLHASKHPYDALSYAPGFTLCRVELDGTIIRQNNKLCASERRIIARIDAKALCLQFARDCATDVLPLWDAPEVVQHFLKTGENPEAASAAASAAYAAASAASAAAYAARAAAYAARAAAYAAYEAASAARAAASAAASAARAAAYAARAAASAAAMQKYRGWFLERVTAQFGAP